MGQKVSATCSSFKDQGLSHWRHSRIDCSALHITTWAVFASSKYFRNKIDLTSIVFRNNDFHGALNYLKKALIYEAK